MRDKFIVASTVALMAVTLVSCVQSGAPAESSEHTPVKQLGVSGSTSFWEHEFELSDGRKITCIESVLSDGYGLGQGLSCD